MYMYMYMYIEMRETIFYINLSHRKDRMQHILHEFARMHIPLRNVIRIDAVLNEKCGHIGCVQSHIKALEYAIIHRLKRIIIFEDDFKFTMPRDEVHKFFKAVEAVEALDENAFDVIMLTACNVFISDNDMTKKTSFTGLKKITTATTASGYIVSNKYLSILLESLKESLAIMENELICFNATHNSNEKLHNCTAFDQHWSKLQKKDTFLLACPEIGTQYDKYYSDNNCSIEHQAHQIKNMQND